MAENYSLQLNSNPIISINTINLTISNNFSSVAKNLITTTNFKIINLYTNIPITNSVNQTNKYSINNIILEDTDSIFQIIFTENNFLTSTPISIQFYQNSSNYSNILNIFSLQLNSISSNSVVIIIPNRIGSPINSNNLIIKNLSNNSLLTIVPSNDNPTLNSQYSILSTPSPTSSSCTLMFNSNFLNSTTNPISIQFKEIYSNNLTVAISTIAYINFPSPYDSKIEISKPYLVKYISKIYSVKITLTNQYDSTLPTNYTNIIYKATKQ